MIRAGYELLGLITFFTAGPKEARAWTVHKGAKAPEAAGAIHTDFERGFIRAETIAYDDYVKFGGEAGASDAGKLRPKARTMWCRTATSCCSASTSERSSRFSRFAIQIQLSNPGTTIADIAHPHRHCVASRRRSGNG